jgi:hypothetical protein
MVVRFRVRLSLYGRKAEERRDGLQFFMGRLTRQRRFRQDKHFVSRSQFESPICLSGLSNDGSSAYFCSRKYKKKHELANNRDNLETYIYRQYRRSLLFLVYTSSNYSIYVELIIQQIIVKDTRRESVQCCF